MGLLSKLKENAPAKEIQGETDRIGGSVLDSDLYPFIIEMAYHKESDKGSHALALKLKNGNLSYNPTVYFTSGTAKGCKHYYEANGEQRYLPGYIVAEAIAQLTCGQGIFDLDAEEKHINLYNFEQKRELPTAVNVFTDLIGKKVILGIHKKVENKSVANQNGEYVKTADTREVNEIDKVFNEEGFTTPELKANATEPAYMNVWVDKYKGQDIDRTNKALKAAPTTGTTATGAAVQSSGMFAK